MNKKILYIIGGLLTLAIISLILSFFGLFLPLYEYKDNSITVDHITYGFKTPCDWHPKKSGTVRIGRVAGFDSTSPVFLYKFTDNCCKSIDY